MSSLGAANIKSAVMYFSAASSSTSRKKLIKHCILDLAQCFIANSLLNSSQLALLFVSISDELVPSKSNG
jgi:hypothetical protein